MRGRVLPVLALALACSGSSAEGPSGEVLRVASDYLRVHNDDDAMVAQSLWGARTEEARERVAWFREQVGECHGMDTMRVVNEHQARFVYRCERGELEIGFRVGPDSGRVTGMWSGARGVEPAPQARRTLDHVVALASGEPVTGGDLVLRGMGSQQLEAQLDALAGMGRCEIDRVHLGSNTGGLFVLACEQGSPTVVIDVDAVGAIERLKVFDHPLDAWRDPSPSDLG